MSPGYEKKFGVFVILNGAKTFVTNRNYLFVRYYKFSFRFSDKNFDTLISRKSTYYSYTILIQNLNSSQENTR